MDERTQRVSDLPHEAREVPDVVYRITDGEDDDWASFYTDWAPTPCGCSGSTRSSEVRGSARRSWPPNRRDGWRRVLLKTDPTQPLFDRYDRFLAYVNLRGGPQLNKAQITRGWAKVLVVGRRFQQYRSFKAAARRANRQGRGAWGLCGGMRHPGWGCGGSHERARRADGLEPLRRPRAKPCSARSVIGGRSRGGSSRRSAPKAYSQLVLPVLSDGLVGGA